MEPEVESRFRSTAVVGGMGFGLEEIHGLILRETESSSFAALLELDHPQAVELLDKEDFTKEPVPPPFFPSNAVFIDRASKFSIYSSTDNSLESSTILSAELVKQEPLDSNSQPNSSSTQSLNPTKRKHRDIQTKDSSKKSIKVEVNEAIEGSGEKSPYVHVRARRGQATNSHSLAERARREKINARMKLLQELVPGCNKISSTALVLDEIINHVQALQCEVELLSMKLAAIDPMIISAETRSSINGSHTFLLGQSTWPERQHHSSWARQYPPSSNFPTPDHSLMGFEFDYPSNSVVEFSEASGQSSKLKIEAISAKSMFQE